MRRPILCLPGQERRARELPEIGAERGCGDGLLPAGGKPIASRRTSSSRNAPARSTRPSGTWQMHGPPSARLTGGLRHGLHHDAACVPAQATSLTPRYEDQSQRRGSTVSSASQARDESGVVTLLVLVLVRRTCVQLGHAHSPFCDHAQRWFRAWLWSSSPSPLALSIRHRGPAVTTRASPPPAVPLEPPWPGSSTHPVNERASCPDVLRLGGSPRR